MTRYTEHKPMLQRLNDTLKHSVCVPTGGHSEGRVTLIGGICGQILTQRNGLFQRAGGHGSAGDCVACEHKANKAYIAGQNIC